MKGDFSIFLQSTISGLCLKISQMTQNTCDTCDTKYMSKFLLHNTILVKEKIVGQLWKDSALNRHYFFFKSM